MKREKFGALGIKYGCGHFERVNYCTTNRRNGDVIYHINSGWINGSNDFSLCPTCLYKQKNKQGREK